MTRERGLQAERALPDALWRRIRDHATHQAHDGAGGPAAAQWRVALAAMLLMDEYGLRRKELAGTERAALRTRPIPYPTSPSGS
ncbi:hypothetical protein NAL89_27420 [Burkholderia glumae]|uniref:hypothetical protein n=1 Tax=Burkholderia glumae TaxID=337 RepID=UPI0020CF0B73|nr:hypothetical protein [Burkholderia glumae]MCQ0040087.1 hypothetical protein [Burkholderia glumae]